MAEKKEDKHYWKDASLVILGAILASVPTLISTNSQQRAHLQQFVLERKITALRDYSLSYNRFAADLLSKLDKFEDTIRDCEIEFAETHRLTDQRSVQLGTEFRAVTDQFNAWSAEVNSQAVVVSLLFHIDIPQGLFFFGQSKPESNFSDLPSEERIRETKKLLSHFREVSEKLLEYEQNVTRLLASTIQQ